MSVSGRRWANCTPAGSSGLSSSPRSRPSLPSDGMVYSDAHHASLAAMVRAAAHAGAVCRRLQREILSLDAESRSVRKADSSPVTVADWASQAVVIHYLRQALGDVVVVAEENARTLRLPEHAPERGRVVEAVRTVWPGANEDDVVGCIDAAHPDDAVPDDSYFALDPIDGTKGFLRGEQYCVSLAMVVDGNPALAALACPNLSQDFGRPFDDPDPRGVLYVAERSAGLYELPADTPDARPTLIRRLDRPPGSPVRVCESVESAHTSHSSAARVLSLLEGPPAQALRLDSQCKYAVVGRGQADAYMRMPSRKGYVERVWDHAAGALIATEGGCFVTDIAGQRLDFSRGRGLSSNRGILCAEPMTHGRLLNAIEVAERTPG
jgi:3'(2'), 5'-bisphosphate nucleotidase